MDTTVFNFLESLGIVEELHEYISQNPELAGDFADEALDSIAIIATRYFTRDQMVAITEFHRSEAGQIWMNQNSQMADDIDKLFKAHAVAIMSQQLFQELGLLPSEKSEESVN